MPKLKDWYEKGQASDYASLFVRKTPKEFLQYIETHAQPGKRKAVGDGRSSSTENPKKKAKKVTYIDSDDLDGSSGNDRVTKKAAGKQKAKYGSDYE